MNATSPRSRAGRWRRWLLLAAAGLFISFYFAGDAVLAALGGWLNVGESLEEPVDYVYVLGGGASTRPFQAAAIYRAGYAKDVLIPQSIVTDEDNEEPAPTEEQLIQMVLELRGVPRSAIQRLAGPVTSTRDEARALATFLADRKGATVAVVTNDFHTRRARLIFRRLIPDGDVQLHFIATPTDGFGPETWWQFPDGVLSYLSEYAKLCRDCLW